MFEKILVCLDGSRLAEQILPYITEEARCFGSKLVLLSVIPEPVIISPGRLPGEPSTPVGTKGMLRQAQKAEIEALAYLDNLAQPLREKGLDIETVAVPGRAGEAILNYAEENGVGLIALATHGRSGLGRAVFGSVADFVLRTSELPVLVIKPKEVKA